MAARPHWAALVLAGGQSRRMGQDKALMDWGGRPMLARVVAIAQACTAHVYGLTPWPERYGHLDLGTICWLTDLYPGEGPLLALVAGLGQIEADWVLLLACDLPCLEVTVLQAWAARLSSLPSTTLAAVPRRPAGWEPLCGFYRPRAVSELQDYARLGGRSLQAWLDQVETWAFAVDSPTERMLHNCNTPDDMTDKK
ncbi:MAG: molybdenum cofactor guanylyltransferase [Gloeomargaritaceae cyanobacterium C42_A2020_066]|nr:molybdenum cofactor guanylyltransferase [Gloeomargaritaceae cyanobacterium C42_A2020_066]